MAHLEANRIEKELNYSLEKSTKNLKEVLLRKEREATRCALIKLPLWGENVASDAINFEWPTQQAFEKMDRSISLKSIRFADWNPAITSV